MLFHVFFLFLDHRVLMNNMCFMKGIVIGVYTSQNDTVKALTPQTQQGIVEGTLFHAQFIRWKRMVRR